MTKRIGFYRNSEKVEVLKDMYQTQFFTKLYSNLFYGFNRKHSLEGILKNINDFEIIQFKF